MLMQQQQEQAPKPKKKVKVTRTINGIEQEVEIEVDADSGPGWGANDKHTLLNHPMTRVDGPLKVSGIAQYTYDVRLPGMLFARILRCPHAHARITNVDTSAAEKIPGVAAVIQGTLSGLRYSGSPVAAVAAKTPEIAGDAIRAIKVTYEVLPHVVDSRKAIEPNAPRFRPKSKNPQQKTDENLEQKAKAGDPQKVEAAFATADAIIEEEYRTA